MARSKTPSPPPTAALLGVVLVVGGNGFLGSKLVQALLDDSSCSHIYILDLVIPQSTSPSTTSSVTYIQGDVTNGPFIDSILQRCQPRVIFHTASPSPLLPYRSPAFWSVNVSGTQTLLSSAKAHGVKAFIYTSSADIYPNPPHINVSESHELLAADSEAHDYARTKAVADRMVREASTQEFKTVCLRVTHLYGEADPHTFPAVLKVCEGNRQLFQVGNGGNLMEVVSLRNTISAHIIAAKALVDPSRTDGEVNGEAFHVSDGQPVEFWHHMRIIWSTARGRDVSKEVIVIPTWLVLFLVGLIEWVYWIFTLGMVEPRGVDRLERTIINFCVYEFTFNSDKARERLRFRPVVDHDNVLRSAVELEMKRRRELAGSRKNA